MEAATTISLELSTFSTDTMALVARGSCASKERLIDGADHFVAAVEASMAVVVVVVAVVVPTDGRAEAPAAAAVNLGPPTITKAPNRGASTLTHDFIKRANGQVFPRLFRHWAKEQRRLLLSLAISLQP